MPNLTGRLIPTRCEQLNSYRTWNSCSSMQSAGLGFDFRCGVLLVGCTHVASPTASARSSCALPSKLNQFICPRASGWRELRFGKKLVMVLCAFYMSIYCFVCVQKCRVRRKHLAIKLIEVWTSWHFAMSCLPAVNTLLWIRWGAPWKGLHNGSGCDAHHQLDIVDYFLDHGVITRL